MEPSSSHTVPGVTVKISDCYQCGKCTAGCPVAAHMDTPPTKIIRLLQLGESETALKARSIWQCVSCQTCSTRCPKSVDCAGVMDELRQTSFEKGYASPEQQAVVVFQRAFLDNVRRNGRLNEVELIAQFKAQVFFGSRSLTFLFRDAGLAPELQKRRKFHLFGEKARDRAVVGRIFERSMGGAQ